MDKTIFIKQDSTLPEIKFPLTQRIMEKYDITNDMMDNVGITFSMIDSNSGIYHIANSEARLKIIENVYEKLDETKYTLTYRFKLSETSKEGRYFGEFKLDFIGGDYCGKITFPTDKPINIIIGSSITKTTVI
jgi:hypothetical protein